VTQDRLSEIEARAAKVADYPETQLAPSEVDRAYLLTALRSSQERERRLAEALEWYGENARLCRLIHSEGDKGRHALADDGGKRAQAALSQKEPTS
jgi:hypothetical protein